MPDHPRGLLEIFLPHRQRVVHVDGVPVGEEEFHLAEIVCRPGLLREGVAQAVDPIPIDLGRIDRRAVIADEQLMDPEDRVVPLLQRRQDVLLHHRLGRVPIRIEDDGLHVGGEHGRGIADRADQRLVGINGLPVLHDVQHERGRVVPHIDVAEVLGHPAPALHVDDQPLDVLVAAGGLGAFAVIAAPPGQQQRLAQALKPLMLGMEGL